MALACDCLPYMQPSHLCSSPYLLLWRLSTRILIHEVQSSALPSVLWFYGATDGLILGTLSWSIFELFHVFTVWVWWVLSSCSCNRVIASRACEQRTYWRVIMIGCIPVRHQSGFGYEPRQCARDRLPADYHLLPFIGILPCVSLLPL